MAVCVFNKNYNNEMYTQSTFAKFLITPFYKHNTVTVTVNTLTTWSILKISSAAFYTDCIQCNNFCTNLLAVHYSVWQKLQKAAFTDLCLELGDSSARQAYCRSNSYTADLCSQSKCYSVYRKNANVGWHRINTVISMLIGLWKDIQS